MQLTILQMDHLSKTRELIQRVINKRIILKLFNKITLINLDKTVIKNHLINNSKNKKNLVYLL
jgi:hypothetical protein